MPQIMEAYLGQLGSTHQRLEGTLDEVVPVHRRAYRCGEHQTVPQEVASGIAQEHPEYEVVAEAVSNATDMVAMARELEAHGQPDSDDQE